MKNDYIVQSFPHEFRAEPWEFPLFCPGEEVDWQGLEERFAWFGEMRGVPQDPVWHAEGDVFVHTKMVVEALRNMSAYQALSWEDQQILFAAALLHDVEKRSTTTEEVIDGQPRIVSPRHAKRGEFTARALLYRELTAPFGAREAIAKLVRLHGLPLWAIQKEDPQKEVIRASQVVNTEHLALLARADVLGRICKDQEEILLRIDLFEELCRENECWGVRRDFASDFARHWYFSRGESSPDFVPFDDSKFTVTLLSALPGTGKDTFIQRYLEGPVLSLDDIRRAEGISPIDRKKSGRVIQFAKEQAKAWMRTRTSFVFNATNISKDMRQKWMDLFTDYGGKVKILSLEVPYQNLLAQNQNRAHKVPPKAIEKMIDKWEIPAPYEAHSVEYVLRAF